MAIDWRQSGHDYQEADIGIFSATVYRENTMWYWEVEVNSNRLIKDEAYEIEDAKHDCAVYIQSLVKNVLRDL